MPDLRLRQITNLTIASTFELPKTRRQLSLAVDRHLFGHENAASGEIEEFLLVLSNDFQVARLIERFDDFFHAVEPEIGDALELRRRGREAGYGAADGVRLHVLA